MKKSCLFLACCLIFLFSCDYLYSPQKRAEAMIESHIRASIENWETCIPMDKSHMYDAYTSAKEMGKYKVLDLSTAPIRYEISLCIIKLDYRRKIDMGLLDTHVLTEQEELKLERELQAYRDTLAQIESKMRAFENEFVPQYIGSKVQYIFQTKNREGDPVVNYFVYYFDANVFYLVDAKQIYRNLPLQTYDYGSKIHRMNLEN